MGIFALDPEYY